MLIEQLKGSALTRAMLKRGDKQVWCAVSDDSDEETMQYLTDNDFTAVIVSFNEDCFISTGGMEWAFATPIKIVALTETEVNLCCCSCYNEHE